MDALTTSNLEDALCLKEKPKETSKKDWDKINQKVCNDISSCLTENIKHHVMYETSARKI